MKSPASLFEDEEVRNAEHVECLLPRATDKSVGVRAGDARRAWMPILWQAGCLPTDAQAMVTLLLLFADGAEFAEAENEVVLLGWLQELNRGLTFVAATT